MGFLDGKRALITGVASNRSIAWGIASAMRRQGAEIALTYQGDRLQARVQKLAAQLDSDIVLPCDVAHDDQIDAAFAKLGERWDSLDIVVHAIAFAPRVSTARRPQAHSRLCGPQCTVKADLSVYMIYDSISLSLPPVSCV